MGLLLSGLCQHAKAQVFMTKTGHAEFDSSVPLHTFTGISNHLVGKISLADSTVDFYLDLHTLKTGIEMRDEDMLQTLHAEKYPFASFYGKLVSPFNANKTAVQQVTVEGDFSIHGVTRGIQIDGTLQKTEEGLQVKASWTLHLDDYNIEPPGILFYRVSNKIPISISATLTPQ